MASLPDVIAALVTTFDGATTAQVFDGPVPTSEKPTDYVLVGSTGEDEDDASADFELSPMGPGDWYDETGAVECSAWSWTGDTDITVPRAACIATFEACRDAVAANRTLGVLPLNGLATVTGMRLRQQQTSAGAICRAVFTVTYRNTLTA